MDVYILRHGKAGIADHEDPDDRRRPLTAQGKEEMGVIGRWLRARKLDFSLIATSPLTRAAETASVVSRTLGQRDRVSTWEELSPGIHPREVVKRLSDLGSDSRVMLVGHEPQLSSIVSLLISGTHSCGIILKKGGIARIRMHDGAAGGELVWLLAPGLIRDWAESPG